MPHHDPLMPHHDPLMPHHDPLMPHNVLYAQPALGLCTEHASNEVLGVRADVLPLRVGEAVLTGPDALLHARGNGVAVVAIERGEPA